MSKLLQNKDTIRHNKRSRAAGSKRLALISLGCAKNLVDSEIMLAKLALAGYELVVDEAEAETIIVNTCGFIAEAKQESLDTIHEVSKLKYSGKLQKLVVTGCLSQRYQHDLREQLPEVDLFTGTNDYARIVEMLQDGATAGNIPGTHFTPTLMDYRGDLPRLQVTPFYTAYLKVAEGCSKTCTFCVIPRIRGGFRSRLLEDVVREAEGLAANGVVELNLIAQEITSYGKDLGGEIDLPRLLRELHAIEELRWIRVLYNYPTELSEAILATYAELPKVCPYIDLPLQHINDRILRLMKRGTRRQSTLALLERIRAFLPQAALRSSFIAGFPGETEAEFDELLSFVRGGGFHRLAIFRYSPEEGSAAAELPGALPGQVVEERLRLLCEARDAAARLWNEQLLGSVQQVLVEGPPAADREGLLVARLATQAPEIDGVVYLRCNGVTLPEAGSFVGAALVEADTVDFIAEPARRRTDASAAAAGPRLRVLPA
ncbi:MAG: 30S ribosomal protein S12 methylthiotransferase RimO [Candidatus Tectomicrobia bacterium]|nr:30S ribosomal protein S12 methylthiotransferase RimO [Candidatus Tectomicrobia bacterium]